MFKTVFFVLMISLWSLPLLCRAEPLDVYRHCRSLPEKSRSQCFENAIEKAGAEFAEKRRDVQMRRDRIAPSDVSGALRAKSRELGAALNLVVGMLAPHGDRGYYDLICLVILLEFYTQEKFWENMDTAQNLMTRQQFDLVVQPLYEMCKKSRDPVICNKGIEEFYKGMEDEKAIERFAMAIGRTSELVMGVFSRMVADAVQDLEKALRESNPRLADVK
ncbi:MAG: hypothetical protein IJU37_07795 [Desulfovibrio sp.]|nr:hypothetical protein [Desulfovibrio sp.]